MYEVFGNPSIRDYLFAYGHTVFALGVPVVVAFYTHDRFTKYLDRAILRWSTRINSRKWFSHQ